MRWVRLGAKPVVVAALVAGLIGAVPVGPNAGTASAVATIDPVIQSQLAVAAPTDMINVLVVLPQQEDVSVIKRPVRAQRRAALVRALQARAAADQLQLRAFLASRRAQGRASKVTPLWIENAIEVTAQPAVIKELATRSDVRAIRAELTIAAPAGAVALAGGTQSADVALVNAPAAWDLGYRGQGIVVANMDTGVDVSHPDLSGRWRGGTNSWYDPNGQHPTSPVDISGHGTWTMGTMVAGSASGTAIGVAPDAKWIAVKIFNDRGTATSTGIHLGFQWLLDPDNNPATDDAPDVVNNSWTMSTNACNTEFQNDLRALRAAGILPVFAAGNYGPTAGSVRSPANLPEAFAVGSTTNADGIDSSSSRGPSSCGQPAEPYLVAPGVNVRTTDLYGLYRTVSGTSMAAPHVAGALALLLSAFPNLAADRQEAALEAGAVDLGAVGSDTTYGYGRLNILAAYNWLNSTPDFAVSASPSTATTAAGGSVTYTVNVAAANGFTGDVALSLTGLSGSQASWSFSPAVVSAGSGTAQLTITTAPSLASNFYPVTIAAQSGSISHTTGVTLDVVAPDFGLTVTPASLTVKPGAPASYSMAVGSSGGFTGDVSLAVTGLPAAVGSAAFVPAVVTTAGNSQLTITTPGSAPAGTYPLTITGTSGSLSHTASVTLVVTPPPDFGVASSPASQTVAAGGGASYSVAVSAANGFTGAVGLSVAGLPGSVGSTTVTPATVTTSGTAQLTVTTWASAPAGTYPLTVTATSGALVHTGSVSLVVTPAAAGDFSLAVAPASVSVRWGQTATYTVTVASVGAFAGPVALSVQGRPSGSSASFTPNPAAAGGAAALTVRTSFFTARGTFTLVVTGTSGTITHQATVVLTVTS